MQPPLPDLTRRHSLSTLLLATAGLLHAGPAAAQTVQLRLGSLVP